MQEPLCVLIVASEAQRAAYLQGALAGQLPAARVVQCPPDESLIVQCRELQPDVVVVALRDGQDGPSAEIIARLIREHRELPVIWVAGPREETIAFQVRPCADRQCAIAFKEAPAALGAAVREVLGASTLPRRLQVAEERCRLLLDDPREAMLVVQQSELIWVNPRGAQLLGAPLGRLPRQSLAGFVHAMDRERVIECCQRCLEDRPPLPAAPFRLQASTGAARWVELQFVRVLWDGTPAVLVLLSESAPKNPSYAGLQPSAATFRILFAESPIGILYYDSHGGLLDANDACLALFGVEQRQLLHNRCLLDALSPVGRELQRFHGIEAQRFETSFDFDYARRFHGFLTNQRGLLQLDVSFRPIGGEQPGGFDGYLVQLQDISKRKQAEATIQSLSQQLLKAQEIERQALACDLHDHLAQDLSSLKIGLDTVCADSPDLSPQTRQRMQELSQRMRLAVMEVRDLAYHLRPAWLDQFGLVQALQQFCEDFAERTKIQTEFFSAGLDSLRLIFDTEINLYRLVQEAFSNIRAHAEASRVKFKLLSSFPMLILRIEDDGVGFEVQRCREVAMRERRMGIWSMEQRVALLGGRLRFISSPGLGTRIRVEVPIKEALNDAQTHPDRR